MSAEWLGNQCLMRNVATARKLVQLAARLRVSWPPGPETNASDPSSHYLTGGSMSGLSASSVTPWSKSGRSGWHSRNDCMPAATWNPATGVRCQAAEGGELARTRQRAARSRTWSSLRRLGMT